MNRAVLVLALALLSFGIASGEATAQPDLYGISPYDPMIAELNPANGSTIGVPVAMTIDTGGTVQSGNGLATDPTSGLMYAILKVEGVSGRVLATMEPTSGLAVEVGNTGMNFAGITFDTAGVLWAVTGDGANPAESLFTIDKNTAVPTFALTLGNGSDGEGIEYNPDDGMIYHLSGRDTNSAYEKINPGTGDITDIGLSPVFDEVFGMVYAGSSTFLVANLDMEFWSLGTDGTATLLGATDEYYRGMAYYGGTVPVEPSTWGGIKAMF